LIAEAIAGGCPLVPAELSVEFLPQNVVLLGGISRLGQAIGEILPRWAATVIARGLRVRERSRKMARLAVVG
jgi:hypothetical protein